MNVNSFVKNSLISLVCSFKFGVDFINLSNKSVYLDFPSGLNSSSAVTKFKLLSGLVFNSLIFDIFFYFNLYK